MKRLLVTGSRHWTDLGRLKEVLRRSRDVLGDDTVLVHGACRGADVMAANTWLTWNLPVESHPANWEEWGRSAGPVRNKQMIQAGADLCIAFMTPESKGSISCANQAAKAGIPVRRVLSWRADD